ncbi:MAG: 3-methyl-2-oxobutanoate dehydrogenase subunit VorB [Spirochaetales bacterium]|nr:3-methyl-2-oxobutanoate dehydrogenase subunit VorB [Spirochaetales bacterium]
MEKLLMKGNEAVGVAAIKAGCRHFFGYPITPQNEIPEFMAREMPKVGGVFLQAESEIAAINMVYGAAGCGIRVMTSSSSPGISLKQEGISYLAGAELPCVIVNMMRGGPGLGSIQPGQADYFQSTRGGGNGDYYTPVLAPSSVQETIEMVQDAFDIADMYRTPVLVLGDGLIGQMMESVEFKDRPERVLPAKDWATVGTGEKREPNIINSLYIKADELEKHVNKLQKKYDVIREKECMWEEIDIEDADVVAVAYGTTSRIVLNAMKTLADEGVKVGLIRPKTLWPFPYKAFEKIGPKTKAVLCVEMSAGQMIDDVKIAVAGRQPVEFYGRSGGIIPVPSEVADAVRKIMGGTK